MLIYKLVSGSAWSEAAASGRFEGAAIDIADGFIHFSTGDTVRETAARHFRGQDDLVIVAVEAEGLGPALKWEVSRGGALFPHLYGPLEMAGVSWVRPLPLGPDGHLFPDELA
jgi:uncharacterized protein (DUF952 family)